MNAEQSSEAVQQPIGMEQVEKQRLKPERIQQTLSRMLGWEERADTPGIHRVRGFGSPAEAEAYVGFATRVAARRRQAVTVSLSGKQVSITLQGRPGRKNKAGLLTDAVYDLACALG